MPNIFNPKPIPPTAYTDGTLWNYLLGNYDVPWLEAYYENKWIRIPMHKDGHGGIITTLVNAGRNVTAEVIGEQIGRTQSKRDGIIIPMLYAHEWTNILKIYANRIERPTRYFDEESGRKIVRNMYVSDRSSKVFAYKQDGSGDVEIYTDCAFNLIDMGLK